MRKFVKEVKVMKTKEYLDLYQLPSEVEKFFDIYGRTREIYLQTQAVLRKPPAVEVTYSSTKEVEVTNGTIFSTKVHEAK